MENYILDYSESAYFKGLTVFIEHLEEGLKIAESKKVSSMLIKSKEYFSKKQTVDFAFLENLENLEIFHFIVSLSKKSKIDNVYNLINLKEFRWSVDNDFQLDFSKINTIEDLNITFGNSLLNWDKLTSLKELFIQKVKTDDLTFLSGLTNLSNLRINGGSLKSLKGIEKCKNIEYIDVQACYKLVEVEKILSGLPKLKGISIESCKKIDLSQEFISKWGEKIFIHRCGNVTN